MPFESPSGHHRPTVPLAALSLTAAILLLASTAFAQPYALGHLGTPDETISSPAPIASVPSRGASAM